MKSEISEKLGHLKTYVGLLNHYQKRSVADLRRDFTLRGAVERYLQLSLEIVIEIAEMIIAKEGLRKPGSHREAVLILGEAGILPRPFAARFAPSAGLRNILVHRYAETDVGKLASHLKNVPDFDLFARHIARYAMRLTE